MRAHSETIASLGARLVIIGNGKPWQARAFLEDHPIDALVLVDPDMTAYAAAGLKRSFVSTLMNAGSMKHAWRAYKGGFRQGRMAGDPWQQGGGFVVTPDNRVHFQYISQEAGDHPDPLEIIEALKVVASIVH